MAAEPVVGWMRMLSGGPTGVAPGGQLSENQRLWLRRGGYTDEMIDEILYRGARPIGPAPETQPDVGRPALGADLTRAAEGVIAARERDINRQLAEAMRRMNIQYGAAGVYRSGERLGMARQLEQTAIRDIAAEHARVGLQEAELAQRGRLGEAGLALQEAQLQIQAQAAKMPMYTAIGQGLGTLLVQNLPRLIGALGLGGAGGTPVESDVGLTSVWEETKRGLPFTEDIRDQLNIRYLGEPSLTELWGG